MTMGIFIIKEKLLYERFSLTFYLLSELVCFTDDIQFVRILNRSLMILIRIPEILKIGSLVIRIPVIFNNLNKDP